MFHHYIRYIAAFYDIQADKAGIVSLGAGEILPERDLVHHLKPDSVHGQIRVEKFIDVKPLRFMVHLVHNLLEQVVAGTVQGMRGGQFDFSPRLLMFTLPFLAQNRAQVTALLQSDLAKKVCAEAEAETGTVIINLCDAGGWRQFSNGKHPITKPEDLQGLKMRTNGMNTIDKTFIALGATTTTIPYSDLYMGLKTGVADGQENPWVNVEGMKFYEVQKYFTEVNYQFHPDPFYVNAAWWNGLPQEYRDIISECATEMGTYNDQLIDENQAAAKQVVIDAGCEVYEPSEEELKAFQEAVQVVYDQCVEEGIMTADELKEMQDIVANTK